DTRHMGQLSRIAPMRIVQGLVSEQAVDLSVLDSRIVEASFDRLEMERVGRRIRPFSDHRLAHTDNAIFSASVRHSFLVPKTFANRGRLAGTTGLHSRMF